MKRLTAGLLLLCILLTGCSQPVPEEKQYTATFLDLFDTVTTIVGRGESEASFQATIQPIHDSLEEYHRLFDIYNDYEGMNNLKTVNDNAGIQPVAVDSRILDLLEDCKTYYTATGGKVNVAMGSVLSVWHQARGDGINDPPNAYLPEHAELTGAAGHMEMERLILDRTQGTVYLSDSEMRLDVGAVAKGWAVQRVCESAPAGLLISVGGNVCATGPKDAAGTPWVIGIQNPDMTEDYLHTIYVKTGSVVTSGDYQRAYVVDGKVYHHIIDPETLYPSAYWRSVTVVCQDSGLADALSTALFLQPQAEGQTLLDQFEAEAMWVAQDGTISYSPGFRDLIRT